MDREQGSRVAGGGGGSEHGIVNILVLITRDTYPPFCGGIGSQRLKE